MPAKSKPEKNGKAPAPVVLNQAINIPLNKLVLSEDNVRKTNADDKAAIAAFADGIARRSLLQSLSVHPVLDGEGKETGTYEVPGGGRRLRALQLLAKQKRLADDVPVPCVVKTDGDAVEDSLAENSDREDLHPLDEFRAFEALAAGGKPDADIGAAFGVTTAVVRQRRRLASVSEKILEAYRADDITLDCVMAFTITEDRARQEQVFKSLSKSHGMEPWQIRRLLTETTVQATDRRARFVGLETYQQAGGVVMRDLFKNDEGGWLQDPALLQRLVDEKLAAVCDVILANGWKWVEAGVEISYQAQQGLLRLKSTGEALSKKDAKLREKLGKQYDDLADNHNEDELPDEVRERLNELEAAIVEMDNRPDKYDPEDIARAGVFVSIDQNGYLACEYGFVRREDAAAVAEDAVEADEEDATDDDDGLEEIDATSDDEAAEQPGKPLSEKLVQDLTSYRTVALRDALAHDFGTAFVAVLHAMSLGLFYHASTRSCLQVSVNDSFPAQAPGLAEWAPAKSLDQRHKDWVAKLPRSEGELWQTLVDMTDDDRATLFAHCASRTVNAVRMPKNIFQSRNAGLGHANTVAVAVDLDMVRAGWVNTVDAYLGRITKDHIVEAVREGKGDNAANLIEHLKKDAMAQEAERLLAGTGWLPHALRMPDTVPSAPAEDLPAFMTEGEGAEQPAAA